MLQSSYAEKLRKDVTVEQAINTLANDGRIALMARDFSQIGITGDDGTTERTFIEIDPITGEAINEPTPTAYFRAGDKVGSKPVRARGTG